MLDSKGGGLRALVRALIVTLLAVSCDSDGGSTSATDAGPPTGASPGVVACGRGAACPQGLQCDPFKGCVSCLFDVDCASGQICKDRACVPSEKCTSDADCHTDTASPAACDPLSGLCVECLTDRDCGLRMHCAERKCVPFDACVNSFDCKKGTVCNRQHGECVECATRGDCGPTEVCANDHCVRVCDGDSDCRDLNMLCDVMAGHCAECVVNADCPAVYHCSQSKCVLDACRAQTGRCTAADAVAVCSPEGDKVVTMDCAPASVCVTSGGMADCRDQLCFPGTTSCSGIKNVVVCASDGLSYASTTPCPDGQGCVNGKCVPQICTPNARACKGDQIGTCNFEGTAVDSPMPCPADNYCDPMQQACAPHICTPNTSVCVSATTVQTCRADGFGLEKKDCRKDEACEAGACVPTVCTPGALSCGAKNEIDACNSVGTGKTVYTTCTGGQVCDDSVDPPTCKTVSCTPGDPVCDGDTLRECNATGTGPDTTSGTDCTKTAQTCFQNACRDVVCKGTSYCKAAAVWLCTDGGTKTAASGACASSEYCSENGTTASCLTRVCTPNATGCNGNVVAKCNADGSGYTAGGTDCGTDKACINAACQPVVCTPYVKFCQSGNVYTCGAQGVSSQLTQTCQAGEYCNPGASSGAFCALDACTAGMAVCRNDFATTCQADGSGPEPTGGTDCTATGKACDGGQCKPVVCTKNARFCSGGNVQLCNATGTAFTLSKTCLSSEFCDATAATCTVDICSAGTAVCNGEIATTCNADGSGYSAGTDCAASSKVCNESVQCAASAVDTIGGAAISAQLNQPAFLGNAFTMRTSRTLTKIEVYLTVSGTADFIWVVYEAPLSTNVYSKIFESTAASGSGTMTFVSSGTIDVKLKASMQYVIGFFADGSETYWTSPLTQTVSFGKQTAIAGSNDGFPPTTVTVGTVGQLYERLTTTP